MLPSIGLLLTLWAGQADETPSYVRQGDRIEQQFRSHRDRLDRFSQTLRGLISRETPRLLPQFQETPPPSPAAFGYQALPRIAADPLLAGGNQPVSAFSYSWPITEGYIAGESVKLDRAEQGLQQIVNAAGAQQAQLVTGLIREYRELLANQRTIDQYVQYNRFWQRSIAEDRARFDRLTKLYDLMKSGEADTAETVRQVLGQPDVPSFIQVAATEPNRVVLRVPVYTDIEDEAFLAEARSAIEEMWQASEADMTYALEIEFRRMPASGLYPEDRVPGRGDHIEVRAHAARFPPDGAVLTTGAQYTHSFVGRYVALSRGDLSRRTLAHEFGHVLGFRDGYIRGYRDLIEHGFEILELTSFVDDIMSAPRQGRVQAAHFRLILDGLKRK